MNSVESFDMPQYLQNPKHLGLCGYMLTFGKKILLQDAEIGVFNFHKMKCIRKMAGCFECLLLDFRILTCMYRRKSVSCMLLWWSCSSKEQPRSARVY